MACGGGRFAPNPSPPVAPSQDGNNEDTEEELVAMWKDTWLQGGGRLLSRLSGGILYEVASRRDKEEEQERMERGGLELPKELRLGASIR